MEKGGVVYIITNKHHTVLYIGVTSDLRIRMHQHINKEFPNSFSAKYNLSKLIYFEQFSTIEEAINNEKYLKGKNRKFKLELIKNDNPNWNDLYKDLVSKW